MLDLKTKKFYLDLDAAQIVKRNFIAAVTWQILALILVLKQRSQDSLDEFHLAFSWWLGYSLILLVICLPRFYIQEICYGANSLTNILTNIQGKLKR